MKKNNKNIELYYDKLCDLWLQNSIELEFSSFTKDFDYIKCKKNLEFIFSLLDKNNINSIQSLYKIEIKLLKLKVNILNGRLAYKDFKIDKLKGGK